MKPLNILLVIVGIFILVVWALGKALAAVIPLVELLWPLVIGVIVLGIAIVIWTRFTEQVKRLFGFDLIRKVALTILLGTAYIPFFYVCYGWILPKLIEYMPTLSPDRIKMIVTLLQLPLIGAMYYLVSPIWPKTEKIRWGFVIISTVGTLFVAFTIHQNHPHFFDHKNGENKIWVSDTEKEIYYTPGYGIKDGKPLRPGTAEDVKKLKEPKTLGDFIKGPSFEEPQAKKKDQPQEPPRHMSGIFRIPGGETTNQDSQGNRMYFRLNERFIIDVLNQEKPNGELLLVNQNLPPIKITKKRTLIQGVPPGKINEIKFENKGKKEVKIEVRII